MEMSFRVADKGGGGGGVPPGTEIFKNQSYHSTDLLIFSKNQISSLLNKVFWMRKKQI